VGGVGVRLYEPAYKLYSFLNKKKCGAPPLRKTSSFWLATWISKLRATIQIDFQLE
jgi:hypothetical protein